MKQLPPWIGPSHILTEPLCHSLNDLSHMPINKLKRSVLDHDYRALT